MSTATDQQAVVIVRFVRPLLGFDDLEFEMSVHPGGYPWFSLHSRDADFPSFLTVDLGAVFDNLEIDIPDDVVADLGTASAADLLILGIVNSNDDFTVNLAGPLVVHLAKGVIAQVVQDRDLPTAAPLKGTS